MRGGSLGRRGFLDRSFLRRLLLPFLHLATFLWPALLAFRAQPTIAHLLQLL